MEQHAVSRLIGAPPGYIGHDEGGQLTETVRRRPYSVVLLDEVEKAHPQVLNILLQVLDDGRLTDGKGRTVDFSNTVIIMTSNVGSEFLQSANGEISAAAREQVMAMVKRQFRPEFLNRLDDILVFHPLTKANLHEIVKVQLAGVQKRLKDLRDVSVVLDDGALELISQVAYDPVYGARPLRRYLEKKVVTELSRLVLSGRLPEHSAVTVIAGPNGELEFRVEDVMRVD
jgi:ATP-dependent Clp protease ATP-binding subunit ClpB